MFKVFVCSINVHVFVTKIKDTLVQGLFDAGTVWCVNNCMGERCMHSYNGDFNV